MENASNVYNNIELIFETVVRYSVLLMELIGLLIILWSVFQCIYCAVLHKQRNLRLLLAHGIAFALEFKLGGEVLRTIVARDFQEIGIIACIIALRAALTFLLHWEVKEEREEDENGRNENDISVIKEKRKAKP